MGEIKEMQLERVDLMIDPNYVYIDKIETGSSPSKIAITLKRF
jgi:hypothetical protein